MLVMKILFNPKEFTLEILFKNSKKMAIELFNKKGINTLKIEEIYGKEESKKLINNIVKDNIEILQNIQTAEIFKEIKEKTNGEVDIASSVGNFYIENEVKNEVIKSLNEELEEQHIETEYIKQENNDLKSLIDQDSKKYKRLVELNNKNKLIAQQLQPARQTKLRKYKK